MVALEDIGKNETIIKVPSREIINTKKAFYEERHKKGINRK